MPKFSIATVVLFVGCASFSQPQTLAPAEAHALGVALAQAKVALATYYFEHNTLPPDSKTLSPNALGLDTQAPVSLTLRAHGTAVLSTASGAQLYAIPTPANDSTRLHWDCVSPDLSDVALYLPGCRYDPGFKDTRGEPRVF